MSTAAENN